MENTENMSIRTKVLRNGLLYKDIAKQIGITPYWLAKLMKSPLSKKNKQRIQRAIDELLEQRKLEEEGKPDEEGMQD